MSLGILSRLEKNKFDEIQRLSNLKEKEYIEVISNLRAELQQYKDKTKSKYELELKRLTDELRKLKAKTA